MAKFDLESTIKKGVEEAINEPVYGGKSITEWAAIGMKAPQWISVTDRLPEKKGDYIAYTRDGIVWPYWFDDIWFDALGYATDTVTHWMPLPEPPKEGQRHEENSDTICS